MKIKNLEKVIMHLREKGFLHWTKNVYDAGSNGGIKLNGVNSVEIFLVGGAIRDALLGKQFEDIKDYDFVVRGIGLNRLGEILKSLGRVDLVGKSFGVYKFVPNNKKMKVPFDIALPRKEISLATGGYRDFKIDYDERLKIKDDLARRDFTINAMAFELKSKKLIDEFGGIKDLGDKKIRTVGNAYERFEEDYSRMLRGVRFACQLNWNFEDSTKHALKDLVSHINDRAGEDRVVPYEVVASEMLKAFVLNPVRAFDLYGAMGMFRELTPELLKMEGCPQPKNWHSEGDVQQHTRLCLKALQGEAFRERFSTPIIFNVPNFKLQTTTSKDLINAELVMAALWHDAGKPYTIQTPEKDGVDRIRFSKHDDVSAKMAKDNFEKLKLSAAPEFNFDTDRAVWLIAKHHLFDTKTIKEMKNSTIEKYFFSDKYNGEDLLKLGFVDMISSLRTDGEPDLTNFDLIVKRINELKKLGKGKRLPQALLNGDEVMEILKIESGTRVGEILDKLRERQLSGGVKNKEEAIKFVKLL